MNKLLTIHKHKNLRILAYLQMIIGLLNTGMLKKHDLH